VSYPFIAALSFAAGLGFAAITSDEWSPPPHIEETGRQVIAAAKIDRGNRCKVAGLVAVGGLSFVSGVRTLVESIARRRRSVEAG
jgi:hypothetical protein